MSEFSLWVYPWDLINNGIEQTLRRLRDSGVNTIRVTSIYHDGYLLLSKRSKDKTFLTPSGKAFFPVDRELYEPGWAPEEADDLPMKEYIETLGRVAQELSMTVRAWTIAFHDMKLPGPLVVNALGDTLPFALCPQAHTNRNYLLSLIKNIINSRVFQAIDLESYGYHGFSHGHHHEMRGIQVGPLEDFLLSRCFCDACVQSARAAGLPVEDIRRRVSDLLVRRLQHDGSDQSMSGLWELIGYLVSEPEILQYVRFQNRSVMQLLGQIRGLGHSAPSPVQLGITSATFARPIAAAWLEGLELNPQVWQYIDDLVVSSYWQEPVEVEREVTYILDRVGEPQRVVLGQSLMQAVAPSLANAIEKVRVAKSYGITRFTFYNYGFLTEKRMTWLEKLAAEIY